MNEETGDFAPFIDIKSFSLNFVNGADECELIGMEDETKKMEIREIILSKFPPMF